MQLKRCSYTAAFTRAHTHAHTHTRSTTHVDITLKHVRKEIINNDDNHNNDIAVR